MATVSNCSTSNLAWQAAAAAELKRSAVFGADVPESELACLVSEAEEDLLPAGTQIVNQTETFDRFLILLEGKVRVSRKDSNGQYMFNKVMPSPAFMGEVPLLSGMASQMTVETATDTRGIRIGAQAFWNAMARCPAVRAAIIRETGDRTLGMQRQQSQQEKLAMLGVMTAGLMHELNNPSAAARRAASQLRDNLRHMHELARTFAERGHTAEQRACLTALQERALAAPGDRCLSSLEQSDAEEEIGGWLDARGLTNAWTSAPVLVASGIGTRELDCLAGVFPPASLAEPLEWIEATASSMQMVTLVENSVARVVELASAVKRYAHEGQGGEQDVDINESIHATVVMMAHKLREKNIHLQKDFGPGIPQVHCVCSGLNQVWTNLLDNAIDAVPPKGAIGIRTALVGDEVQIKISDNGPGISPENRERIFDPFFTTKGAGVGSGLGLGIVQKILFSYDGTLTLESEPGHTEFTVHLPAKAS